MASDDWMLAGREVMDSVCAAAGCVAGGLGLSSGATSGTVAESAVSHWAGCRALHTQDRREGTTCVSQVLIAPSILSADFAMLGQQVREAEAGGADWIHVDVMDGHFVPQISFGEPIVRALRPVTSLPLDVHLMIEPVDPQLEAFAAAGADSITVHVEATPDPARTLRAIRDLGYSPRI